MATTSTILSSLGLEGYFSAEMAIVVVVAVACTLSIITFVISQKRTRLLHQKIDRLQHDLRVANSGAIGMGQQLLAVEKQLHSHQNISSTIENHKQTLQAQSDTLRSRYSHEETVEAKSTHRQEQDDDAIYHTARQLLAEGVDLESIAKQSGLSYAEVSLINALNRQGLQSTKPKKMGSKNSNIHPLSTPL